MSKVNITGLSKLSQAKPLDLQLVFQSDAPPADYIVPGILAGGVFGIVGPGSVGKSFLAFNLILGSTICRDMIGGVFSSSQPGKVLYLPNEDPCDELSRRLKQIQAYLSQADTVKVEELAEIIPLKGLNPWLMSGEGQPVIEHIQWLSKICIGKRLVILDTLRRFHLGNENDSAHMATLLGILEAVSYERGCTFVFLHHANKSAIVTGSGENSAAIRGSGVLTDNARGQFNLVSVSKKAAPALGIREDLACWYVQIVPSKINHGRPQEPTLLQRQPGGVLLEATPERVKDLEKKLLRNELPRQTKSDVEDISSSNSTQSQLTREQKKTDYQHFIPGFIQGGMR